MSNQNKLTTTAGCPVVDNKNMLTVGVRGPQLIQDVWLLEKPAQLE
jgi:catalase